MMMTLTIAVTGRARTAPANPPREPRTNVAMITPVGDRFTAFFMIRGWIT